MSTTPNRRPEGLYAAKGKNLWRQKRVDSLDLPDDRRTGIHQQSSTETSGIGSLGPDGTPSANASIENINTSPTEVQRNQRYNGSPPQQSRDYRRNMPQLIVTQPSIKGKSRMISMDSYSTNRDQRYPMDQYGEEINDNESIHSNATDFDELFESNHRRNSKEHLQIPGQENPQDSSNMDDLDYEQSRGLLPRSPSSRRKSNQTRRFLNTPTSAWLQWSEERRASYKKKKEILAQKQKEMEDKKIPTPVKKARKESVIFMAKVDANHLIDSDEEDRAAHRLTVLKEEGPAVEVQTTPRKQKKNVQKKTNIDDFNLTPGQWKTVFGFWQHRVFVRARHIGLIFAPIAAIFGIISCVNDQWTLYPEGHHGLWSNCTTNFNFTNETHSTPFPDLVPGIDEYCGPLSDIPFGVGIWTNCYTNLTMLIMNGNDTCSADLKFTQWQNAVIGLIVFALGFGLLATILVMCGLCALQLPRKVYYFHSAGEIYFVCALSATAALVIYPAALELMENVPPHTYSWGYVIGWGLPACFYVSSLCMTLDDMIHSTSRGCPRCLCCTRRQTPLNHV